MVMLEALLVKCLSFWKNMFRMRQFQKYFKNLFSKKNLLAHFLK